MWSSKICHSDLSNTSHQSYRELLFQITPWLNWYKLYTDDGICSIRSYLLWIALQSRGAWVAEWGTSYHNLNTKDMRQNTQIKWQWFHTPIQEEFEDTKGVIRIHISKKNTMLPVSSLCQTRIGAVVVVIVWKLDLQLPVQSMRISSNIVCSNPANDEV